MHQIRTKPSHRWVRNNKGTITISFNLNKVKYSINPVAGGKFDNPQDLAIANVVAAQIEEDIRLGQFEGIDKYRTTGQLINIKNRQKIPSQPKALSLLRLWENYKTKQAKETEETSQKTKWLAADRMVSILGAIPIEKMTTANAVELLLETYKSSTIRTALNYVHAALELAVKCKEIPENPLAGFKAELPKHTNLRQKSGFSLDAIGKIIEAFQSDRYTPAYSNFPHSYYTDFVEFLFLTGLRPQMPIALSWSDIKTKQDGSRVILFDRAYTNGVLKQGKNKRAVIYPVYPQLGELIDQIPRKHEVLVFPSPTGGFINLNNFTSRYWGLVVKSLVQDGEIPKYFPTYHCRHTAATLLAGAGVPLATIAALLDTSEEMLNKHYLDNNELSTSLSINILY